MSQFNAPDLTPNPEDLLAGLDFGEPSVDHAPPGGTPDWGDALADALAAVEAVEAKRISGLHDAEGGAIEIGAELHEASLESAFAQTPEIRGMPTVSSAAARAQLEDTVRDLKIKLADARHRQERDQREIEQLHSDLGVTRKRYHKLSTDHDEMRKRLQRAELDLPDQGARSVLQALLGPLDHLHEVVGHVLEKETLTSDGRAAMQMLQQQWQRALTVLQVTPYDALEQKYDPQVHEFIAQMQSDVPQGHVARQVGRGYLLAGRLLRPARVVVSSGVNPPRRESMDEPAPDLGDVTLT